MDGPAAPASGPQVQMEPWGTMGPHAFVFSGNSLGPASRLGTGLSRPHLQKEGKIDKLNCWPFLCSSRPYSPRPAAQMEKGSNCEEANGGEEHARWESVFSPAGLAGLIFPLEGKADVSFMTSFPPDQLFSKRRAGRGRGGR